MNRIILAGLSLILFTAPSFSRADDGWTERLNCENGGFVVDGFHTYEDGFTHYQAVIRNPGTLNYFGSFFRTKILNNRGEMVVKLDNKKFTGAFEAHMNPEASNADTSFSHVFYTLTGNWTSGGDYEIRLSSLYYTPGSTYREPNPLGNWVFRNCRWLR